MFYSLNKTFAWTSQIMLKENFILQVIHQTDHYLKEKNKKVIGLMKNELGGKITTTFATFKPKTQRAQKYVS